MKTNWDKVEDLIDRLEDEGRGEDSMLVDQLYSEIDDTESELSSCMEMLRAYDTLFGKIEAIVDYNVKVEIACFNKVESKWLKDILDAMNDTARESVYGDIRVLKGVSAKKVANYDFNE